MLLFDGPIMLHFGNMVTHDPAAKLKTVMIQWAIFYSVTFSLHDDESIIRNLFRDIS